MRNGKKTLTAILTDNGHSVLGHLIAVWTYRVVIIDDDTTFITVCYGSDTHSAIAHYNYSLPVSYYGLPVNHFILPVNHYSLPVNHFVYLSIIIAYLSIT